ncbi:TetR/AcrR family transcriptional regulator [Vineibacter terrae]|uniref:TetR/AcrR family transcriptional regulator n=1 Tax=Vineibacter terrae TaxID=2586908 RepID=UPI002E30B0B5|nr:TetR/AcrR family transcriptional regulator [Vineibacter terrae]HEX2890337.1 TetR/AcrR family transcriptional regulator [Vineibacter terrae]
MRRGNWHKQAASQSFFLRRMVAKATVRARSPKNGRTGSRRERPNVPDRILDVAEELFGRSGYGSTTTRAIAQRARVHVGQLHYYFDSKRALFEAVVARHGRLVTEARRRLLHEAQAKWPRGDIPIEVLVDALVRSLLLVETTRSGAQRTASLQMHARLFTDPDETASQVRADIYDETNALYVAAFRRALPRLSAEVVYWRYYFMMGAYVWTLLQPGRLEPISQGRCDPSDMEAAIREIVPFLCAGLAAPLDGQTSDSPLPPAAVAGPQRRVRASRAVSRS